MLHLTLNMPMIHMALYGSIMIVLVLFLRTLLRSSLPKFVFPVLWGVVLLRLLVPFSLSSPISAPVPNLAIPSTRVFSAVNTVVLESVPTTASNTAQAAEFTLPTHYSSGFDWPFALLAFIILGGAITACVLLSQKYRYSCRLKNSLLLEHNETVNAILREMGMGHVLVFTCDEIASPLVAGAFNPRIYLPTGMDFTNTTLLRHILTHEVMHIKRGDNWVKGAMLLTLCVHWYNPLVWLMSKALSSDLEAACDAAVLRQTAEDTRQSYALSLLSMAVSGNRPTLLYSAFSKVEVERRIHSVLHYKKATAFVLVLSMVLLLGSTVAFASGGQAPFDNHLSSFCSSHDSKWGVKVMLSRDISLGEKPQKRADNVIFDVLEQDKTEQPAIIKEQLLAALSAEFGVEKSAFVVTIRLSLTEEQQLAEYGKYGLTKDKEGFFLYKGEKVRVLEDEMQGTYQSVADGTVDVLIERDEYGAISLVTTLRTGDGAFDRRTKELERSAKLFESDDYTIIEDNQTVIQKSIGNR